MGKSRAVIGWKKTNERASLAHDLEAAHEFFLSVEGEIRNFDENGFKSRWMERKAALGKNRESTVIIMLNTDRIL